MRINGNLKENIRKVANSNGYTLSNYLNKIIEAEVSSYSK